MERTYTIPLRSECLKVPIFLRARKCIKAVKNFTIRHMKVEDVKIGKHLNLKIWERGSRHPPSKVQVIIEVVSEKKGNKEIKFARVELVGAPKEVKKVEEKKGLAAKLKDKVTGKDEKSEAKAAEIKAEEKIMEKAEAKKMETAKAPLPEQKDTDKKKSMKPMKEHNVNIDKTPMKEKRETPKLEK
ncbi:MAG: 50S ribosomal protein L31e [Candidatus Nanoarchaeia archaeon]|nr:50S ribosomal protein L31e [Candidatus Nanoarchaeia archaeon]